MTFIPPNLKSAVPDPLLGTGTPAVRLDEIETQLSHEPTIPTNHRKLLRPNPVAAWELRVGEFRVFYNVQQESILVVVVAVDRKAHNQLTIDGKVIPL